MTFQYPQQPRGDRLLQTLCLVCSVLLLLGNTAKALEASILAGQRCLYAPCQRPSQQPLLVILGGMAQSIASWEQHVPALSQSRSLLIYEARGQGPPTANKNMAEDYLKDVSLPAQAQYLVNTLDELQHQQQQGQEGTELVDIAGFSLGGRIAMAMAALYPQRSRKLHLTGVAADRSVLGHLTVRSWKDHVRNSHNLKSFAWSVLLATYSPTYLQQLQDQGKLDSIINFVAQQNTAAGLSALLEQAHVSSDDDMWSTTGMARQIMASKNKMRGCLCVGELDSDMAPVSKVVELSEILQWDPPTILENCGHAVPMEQARPWRNHLLEFLNDPS